MNLEHYCKLEEDLRNQGLVKPGHRFNGISPLGTFISHFHLAPSNFFGKNQPPGTHPHQRADLYPLRLSSPAHRGCLRRPGHAGTGDHQAVESICRYTEIKREQPQ